MALPEKWLTMRIAKALTIAGSDSGGGAGIQADLKSFSARGVYGTSVITAVTAQNTIAVTHVEGLSGDSVTAQIRAVLGDIAIDTIKIGMLGTASMIDVVVDAISGFSGAIVVDPVITAKSGDALLHADAIAALRDRLLPMATLLTPNLPEAGQLLETSDAADHDSVLMQGQALRQRGAHAVLMKGGHASGDNCTDILLTADGTHVFSAPRLATTNTHGTGCSMSAAIAAELAKGADLRGAVETAHGWLHEAISRADTLAVGNGHGPVHHFHEFWQ